MSAHSIALDRLVPYVDEALPLDERADVQTHVHACPSCALELKRVFELNALLDGFPPAPPANFASFWLRLRARLPRPAQPVGYRGFVPGRRAALAFALAAIMALAIGTGAFAAETSLPDNPLYPVKLGEEQVQLFLAFAPETRLQVEIDIAGERLREARAMEGIGKPALAADAVRDFRQILNEIKPELNNQELAALQLQLTALQQVDFPRTSGLVATGAHQLGVSGEEPEDLTAAIVVATGPTTTKPTSGTSGHVGDGDHHGDGDHGSAPKPPKD